MPPKKGDSKSAAKKGKSEEPKKGGKDDKKGGKDDKKGGKKSEEPPAKGKGKDDGKKGKGKKPVSESEEGSEEEEEEVKSEEDEDESEEEVVTKKPDKGKGKAALKGASKAMAVKGLKPPPKQSPASDDDEDEEEKPQVKKGMGAVNLKKMSDVQVKGASKAMMGFAAEGQKKNIAAAKPDAKIQLKGATKALTGITGKASPFSMPSKQAQQEKAKPKRNLKTTSRLFLRLSKKKKPSAGAKPLLGASKLFAGLGAKSTSADKKPGLSGFSLFNKKNDAEKEATPPKKTLNLSSLGGKGKMAAEAKGLGGKFKGMFGKKKSGSMFKTKGWMLGRMAAATNWITGQFLTSKGQGHLGARARNRGQKRLSFADRDTRGRQTHYYNEAYEYDDDEYGYEEDYYDRRRPGGFMRQPMPYDPYDPYGEEMDYYDDEEWEDEYGYYDEEGNFYYDDEFYYNDDMDYYGYPYGYYDDEYEDYYGDEGMEYYYGEDGLLYAKEPQEYGYYDDPVDGFYDPYELDDYSNHYLDYNSGMLEPYGMINGGYDVVSALYNDPVLGYADPIATYNHQPPFYMDTGLVPAETAQLYGHDQLFYPPAESFSAELFRVPRPQVRLFGKDKLEVETLPPPPSSPVFLSHSPSLALNNLEMMSDIEYEQPFPTYNPAQPHLSPIMNQQQIPPFPGQVPALGGMTIQQEHLPLPQASYHPVSASLSQLSPSPLTAQLALPVYQPPLSTDQQMFQMRQMSPMVPTFQPQMHSIIHSPLHSPVASPMPMRRMSPLSSPQLSLRYGPARPMAPPPPHLLPHHMDIQRGIQPEPHLSPRLHRRGLTHRRSIAGQRPTSSFDRHRPPSPPASPPPQRRGMSVRTQPSLARGRGRPGLRRASSTIRPQSPLSSPLNSPRSSLRKRASPPLSPRLSFRQNPPPDAVPLPSTRPHLFKGRKQTSMMRHSPSPTLPSPQRRSPTLPERSQSPRQSFRPTSPRRPPSPSPSRITSRPFPTRSSTRRMRGGAGGHNQVPMGAVKPSPGNPYLQRRSRHGPPITQHVAPFRSSIHSGPSSPSGQIGSIAGTPMLTRTGSRPTGLRESSRAGTPQRGFHRPVGRGQPLVRMPRNQTSLQSRQSFRAPPPGSPQPSLKQSGPLSPQPSVRRLQSRTQSPQPLLHQSPLLSRSTSPMRPLSHPPSPLPHRAMSPQSVGAAHFQPSPYPNLSPGILPPSQSVTQYDYTMMDPGPSPMLTNALPNSQIIRPPFPPSLHHSSIPYSNSAYSSPLQRPASPQTQHDMYTPNLPQAAPLSPHLGRTLQNPYLQNISNTSPLQRSTSPIPDGQMEISTDVHMNQEVNQHPTLGLSNALMQNSRLRSASYSSPLQRNANLYTTVLSPTQAEGLPVPSAHPSQSVRGTSPLFSGGLRTSQIQGSMFRLPSGTLKMPRGPGETPVTTDGGGGGIGRPLMLSNALQNPSLRQATYRLPDGSLITRSEPVEPSLVPSHLSSPMLSSALLNPSLRQATYRLPDGSLVTRTEPTPVLSPTSPMLSSALLNPNVRKATYRLPDGTLITRNEPAPSPMTSSSPKLSSALLNPNVRKASYRLPDGSLLTHPVNETQNAEVTVSSPGLSSALMNANLRKAKFQLPEGSSLFSRNQPQQSSSATSGPLLSGALLNTSLCGASYKLSDSLRQPGSSEPRSLDLSNALRNQNLRSATYRLPDGTLMTRPQPTSAPKTLDLSNALSKNPNLRAAKYRLPDGNIMTRLGAPKTPEPRTLNLSGALKNPNLRGASFRLPSSYAVVSPQVQGSGPEQHWAHGPGVDGSGLQQDGDVWGAERVLPHGTVQNLNKWSMYRDGELLDPQGLAGQGHVGQEPGEWNLSREGEPHGNWFDKVNILNHFLSLHSS